MSDHFLVVDHFGLWSDKYQNTWKKLITLCKGHTVSAPLPHPPSIQRLPSCTPSAIQLNHIQQDTEPLPLLTKSITFSLASSKVLWLPWWVLGGFIKMSELFLQNASLPDDTNKSSKSQSTIEWIQCFSGCITIILRSQPQRVVDYWIPKSDNYQSSGVLRLQMGRI